MLAGMFVRLADIDQDGAFADICLARCGEISVATSALVPFHQWVSGENFSGSNSE